MNFQPLYAILDPMSDLCLPALPCNVADSQAAVTELAP